jgi:HEPN domain-containing protein
VYWDELGDIDGIELTDIDPDAAHVTLVRRPNGWLISFDFRYNAATAKQTLTAAREFLVAAELSLEDGRTRAFADELHSATELMAKALLMLVPDEKYLTSNNHKFFAARFNSWGKLGNVPRPFVKLLNDIRALRPPARYLQGSFDLAPDRADEMLKVARDMMAHADVQIPGRVPMSGRPIKRLRLKRAKA